jgi:hypothetical protein
MPLEVNSLPGLRVYPAHFTIKTAQQFLTAGIGVMGQLPSTQHSPAFLFMSHESHKLTISSSVLAYVFCPAARKVFSMSPPPLSSSAVQACHHLTPAPLSPFILL